MKTSEGLIKYVEIAHKEKWGYVWGTFGNMLTEAAFKQKLDQYPNEVGKFKDFITKNWLGRKTADCVGLIKSYLWFDGKVIKYDSKFDVNANQMYENAKEKGTILTIPEIPGLCVWKKGHIGVYVGNGRVIEAHGTMAGVIETPLKGNGATSWTHWLKCPYIEYANEVKKQPEHPVLQIGSKGADVLELQKALNKHHYNLKEDGDFGKITQAAVRDFQRQKDLIVNGIVTKETWSLL